MRLLITAALLFGTSVAYADKGSDVRQMHTDDCAVATKLHKTCVLDMGKGDTVEASVPGGTGVGVGVITMTKEPSLIRLRRDFIVEILKTAEDL